MNNVKPLSKKNEALFSVIATGIRRMGPMKFYEIAACTGLDENIVWSVCKAAMKADRLIVRQADGEYRLPTLAESAIAVQA